jgi:hypothetical protein
MAYALRQIEPWDRDALLRLWRDNLATLADSAVGPPRYSWAYERHPHGGPLTILAVNSNQEVIGCGSLYPRTIFAANIELTTGMPSDFAVDRKHRIGGAAVMMQRHLAAESASGFQALLAFPNKAARPILQRVGYKPLVGAFGWVKPLRVNDKLQQVLGSSRWLTGLASAPVNLALWLADGWRSRRLSGDRVEILERADHRFDDLWRRAADRYPIAGERTSAYLNWRYAEHATNRHRFFCLLRDGQLVGYIAFSTERHNALVGDLFAIDMTDTADRLLLHFARQMRKNGCATIFVVFGGNSGFEKRLRALGFIRRGDADREFLVFVRDLKPETAAVLTDSQNWYLFDGEMDI